jgi:ADP-ribose pyrophosphatase YjhB (NUDIX family)
VAGQVAEYPNAYAFPGGHAEPSAVPWARGQEAYAAAVRDELFAGVVREVAEELGVHTADLEDEPLLLGIVRRRHGPPPPAMRVLVLVPVPAAISTAVTVPVSVCLCLCLCFCLCSDAGGGAAGRRRNWRYVSVFLVRTRLTGAEVRVGHAPLPPGLRM